MSVRERFGAFARDDSGGAMVEYGLLAAALAIPMLGALAAIVATCGATLQSTGNGLTQIGTNP